MIKVLAPRSKDFQHESPMRKALAVLGAFTPGACMCTEPRYVGGEEGAT
jgi:hypothetical protein